MNNENSSKEEYIERLFASISPKYDLLNSILSCNSHKRWRRFAAKKCGLSFGDNAVDVCAGTLDFAIELSRVVGEKGEVAAVDFCKPMLDLGKSKLEKKGIRNIASIHGNAESLPLPSDKFHAATIGFALRNVSSVEKTLSEMKRVVVPGGKVVCLEFSRPNNRIVSPLYNLYSSKILPLIGGMIHGSEEPYQYLPESIAQFHSGKELLDIMEKIGLKDSAVYALTVGIVSVYVGVKK